ncbi:Pc12g06400 [Penicillium rubens Wisconsin 54-1255]|uniref:Pc12g06400 protein n=1 Tax=Penicillium rubens (strain ATCC 28089 / DSM 1075 / NRRL 1951 / Wisconsin 54-1255) TaxID=500485 RepID=B6H0D6_PENRW|nr:Pc12g06400 [Penicillium rubens Wisconsin 54-1255]
MDALEAPELLLLPHLSALTPKTSLLIGLALAITAYCYYRHTQHPLYKFPGPRSAAWSNVLYCYYYIQGRQPFKLLELHNQYGSVVRTAPNDLSFNTAGAFRDIYNFRPGHETFIKSDWYDGGVFADKAHSIVSEREPGKHGHMRKYLSHAFSDKSLKAQEPLIDEVVNEFVSQLDVFGSRKGGIDIVVWFNLATFDIIGSLAFGESFGGVKSGEVHPWISRIITAIGQSALADAFKRFPAFATTFKWLFPKAIERMLEDTAGHENYTISLIDKRLGNPSTRPDFLTRMLENRPEDLTDVQIAAHASDFVIAGSETTATTLSCIVYYLTKNPSVYQKATQEIRDRFERFEDINSTAALQLKYLHALALEAMRIYPPLPLALPRVVPKGGDTIDGHFVAEGTIVSVNPVAACLSTKNFDAPLEFRPERWLESDLVDDHEASQPFSMGPRACLGRNLAWIELSLLLSKILWVYDIELLNTEVDWLRDSRMAMLWKKPKLMIKTTHMLQLAYNS